MKTEEREKLHLLMRRRDWLEERIGKRTRQRKQATHDQAEHAALVWAIDLIVHHYEG